MVTSLAHLALAALGCFGGAGLLARGLLRAWVQWRELRATPSPAGRTWPRQAIVEALWGGILILLGLFQVLRPSDLRQILYLLAMLLLLAWLYLNWARLNPF